MNRSTPIRLPEPARLLRDEPGYPTLLQQRLGQSAPPLLHCCGALPRFLPPMLAVVGTRAATLAAMATTTKLAAQLCHEHGFGIVSGGAIGIDAAAHRGALDAGGFTIAVLGSGLRQLYPQRNRRLFAEISTHSGALLTHFEPDDPPRRGNFIARNRLVAALAEAVLVAEAPLRSGALNTARQARELDIPVLALAGSPGTGALIASGATEIRSADEVTAALAGELVRAPRVPEHADDRAVIEVLAASADSLSIDALAARAAMSVPRVAAALVRLEVDGWVQPEAGLYRALARPD